MSMLHKAQLRNSMRHLRMKIDGNEQPEKIERIAVSS